MTGSSWVSWMFRPCTRSSQIYHTQTVTICSPLRTLIRKLCFSIVPDKEDLVIKVSLSYCTYSLANEPSLMGTDYLRLQDAVFKFPLSMLGRNKALEKPALPTWRERYAHVGDRLMAISSTTASITILIIDLNVTRLLQNRYPSKLRDWFSRRWPSRIR